VAVNLLEPDPTDVELHRPLPIAALLDHAHRRGLLRYRRYHGRAHLVVYRPETARAARVRSAWERGLGGRIPGSLGRRIVAR
jgi:hypothetical protein